MRWAIRGVVVWMTYWIWEYFSICCAGIFVCNQRTVFIYLILVAFLGPLNFPRLFSDLLLFWSPSCNIQGAADIRKRLETFWRACAVHSTGGISRYRFVYAAHRHLRLLVELPWSILYLHHPVIVISCGSCPLVNLEVPLPPPGAVGWWAMSAISMSDSIAGPVRFTMTGVFKIIVRLGRWIRYRQLLRASLNRWDGGIDPTMEWALSASMSAAVGLGREAAERFGRHGFAYAPHGKDCLASEADSEMAAGGHMTP